MFLKINKLNLYCGLLFFILSMVIYLWPSLDIAVANLFYQPDAGFVYSHSFLVRLIFKAVPVITMLYAGILIIRAIFLYFRRAGVVLHLTLLASIIIGPGLIVNYGFKDNFGRARPKQIIEFGAQKEFTKVYQFSDQCRENCSFSSGHAAAAYSLTTIAYIVPPAVQALTFFLGIGFGCLVGFGRIIQGGHFISDVFASGAIVLLVNYLLFSIYSYFKGKKIQS